jgi:hypothetical protein
VPQTTEHNVIQNINLSVQTVTQLDNLIRNRTRFGDLVGAREAAIERIGRGRCKPHHLAYLSWTPEKVQSLLTPFAVLADRLSQNSREEGVLTGGRCRKNRKDPDRLWVDRYVGLTVPPINATIACHIKTPGDDPILVLTLKMKGVDRYKQYSIGRLDTLLKIWEKLCKIAKQSMIH